MSIGKGTSFNSKADKKGAVYKLIKTLNNYNDLKGLNKVLEYWKAIHGPNPLKDYFHNKIFKGLGKV